MKTVDISFQNSRFTYNCDDPDKLLALAEKVNALAETLGGSSKGGFDSKILLLTALLLQEQLDHATANNTQAEQQHEQEIEAMNSSLVKTIDKISSYIENLAMHLEKV